MQKQSTRPAAILKAAAHGRGKLIHLHVLRGPVTFTDSRGNQLARGGGVSLCGRASEHGRKPAQADSRCPRCVAFAGRYAVPWPFVDGIVTASRDSADLSAWLRATERMHETWDFGG